MTDQAHKNTNTGASPVFYLAFLPGMVEVAKQHGYALAVHGSLARDFDLIAVPWTDAAGSCEDLIRALMDHTGARMRHRQDWELKPHQRRCFCLYLGGGPYLDISVMPRVCDAQHHMPAGEPIHEED